jgi:DNA (cytosine-5)-methyltransferase 1
MKILNLYAGIGGNRKLWPKEHKVTAVEINPEIARIYKGFFPDDDIIVEDAHRYLLEHYKEYDFIWSSPPCPTHSQFRQRCGVKAWGQEAKYPDMKLYEEIIFLQYHVPALFVVENVVSYYDPLIKPYTVSRH